MKSNLLNEHLKVSLPLLHLLLPSSVENFESKQSDQIGQLFELYLRQKSGQNRSNIITQKHVRKKTVNFVKNCLINISGTYNKKLGYFLLKQPGYTGSIFVLLLLMLMAMMLKLHPPLLRKYFASSEHQVLIKGEISQEK